MDVEGQIGVSRKNERLSMQHYPSPFDVAVPEATPRPTRRLRAIIERDGLIVPILVRTYLRTGSDGRDRSYFCAADGLQGERVLACRELGWDSILVETSWTKDDL
jgi:hypothetical protein